MFSFPDCENPLNRDCYYFKPQGSYDIQKPKRMFFKFTFVFTWLKLSVKKGSKQNKTKKKTRTVTLRPHHVRQSRILVDFYLPICIIEFLSLKELTLTFFFNSLEQIRK